MKNIRLEWDGPYNLDDIGYVKGKYTYDEEKFIDELNQENRDYGIYQAYGSHPVYGNNVLLYIGKAAQQTFAKRLSQEGWEYNQDAKNIQFYVGRLFIIDNEEQPNNEIWNDMIDKAERMLIHAHEPARNSSNILNITKNTDKLKEFETIRIFNYDSYKSLIPEISGELWVKEFNNSNVFIWDGK
ncbi:hypothetical protein [Sulfurimonas sp.]|uniref:hypothetical protein n=1 Tax=Sulfurimonas sp. TaxID=2022749 RepID=UPI0025E2DD83|nr:hypothetical protein [Sulfurimonas sp.]